jgi:hypothetical protein
VGYPSVDDFQKDHAIVWFYLDGVVIADVGTIWFWFGVEGRAERISTAAAIENNQSTHLVSEFVLTRGLQESP